MKRFILTVDRTVAPAMQKVQFTDKKVASHAVRVPVTKNLSANIAGFLPVHCVHQLLKSRAFSKYKVNFDMKILHLRRHSLKMLIPKKALNTSLFH